MTNLAKILRAILYPLYRDNTIYDLGIQQLIYYSIYESSFIVIRSPILVYTYLEATKNERIQYLYPTPATTCLKYIRLVYLTVRLCIEIDRVGVIISEGLCIETDEVGVIKAKELEVVDVEVELDSRTLLLRLLYIESGYKSQFCILSRPALLFLVSIKAIF